MLEATVLALLEFRLSERWLPLLLAETAALLIAGILIAEGLASFERPSRVVLVTSLFVLAGVWYDGRRAEMSDKSEKREALHAALPATRVVLAAARVAEPLFPLGATALVVVAAFALLGRGALLADGPWSEDLLLFLGAATWLLVLETAQLAAAEFQLLLQGLRLGWLFWIGVVVCFGLPGLLFGYLLGDGTTTPFIFYLALGRPGSMALALTLALLLALLGVLMYRDRDAQLGTC